MAHKESLGKRWENYRPSKALWLWSCVASVIVTIVIGFAWGGWVTGGTATRVAEEAAAGARAQLAAQVCFNRFASSPDAATHLAALRDVYVHQCGATRLSTTRAGRRCPVASNRWPAPQTFVRTGSWRRSSPTTSG